VQNASERPREILSKGNPVHGFVERLTQSQMEVIIGQVLRSRFSVIDYCAKYLITGGRGDLLGIDALQQSRKSHS
jgi:hypothetical protein